MRYLVTFLLFVLAEVIDVTPPRATRVPTPVAPEPTPIVVSECGQCCGQ